VAAVTALAALLGWLALHLDYLPSRPTVACDQVFATPPTLEPSGASYRVRLHPLAHPRAAVIAFQIIDSNGFGWFLQDTPGKADWQVPLPAPYPIRTVRVGVLAPAEAQRARAIDRAARAFDVGAWVRARGWAAPALTLCRSFDTHG